METTGCEGTFLSLVLRRLRKEGCQFKARPCYKARPYIKTKNEINFTIRKEVIKKVIER